jgi:hypothetical protein
MSDWFEFTHSQLLAGYIVSKADNRKEGLMSCYNGD